MSAFIDSFTTQQLVPPWKSTGARIWSLVIKVPPLCIQNYLDSHFNAAGPDQAPLRYTALAGLPYGLLTTARHEHFASEALGSDWNVLRHTEVHWSVPVARERITPDNLLVDRQIVWVQPFAFDDNSSVLLAGREILGTEFEMGKIRFQEGATPGDLHIDVAVQGFERFTPRSRSKLIPVLHAKLSDSKGANPVDQHAIGAFLAMLDPASPGEASKQELFPLPSSFEVNTLKQFRDVFDMRFAAYRALIASRTTYSAWQDVRSYEGANVALDLLWTDSLKEKFIQLFGLSEPSGDTIPRGHPGLVGAGDAGAAPDPDGIDWDLPRSAVPVAFAFSYTANVRYEVSDTLHVYGQV